MRFLKQKTLSKYSPSDNTFIAYDTRPLGHTQDGGRAIMDLTGGLRLPKGTTLQRPEITGSGIRTPDGANGYIRYNTTTNSLEAYIDNVWEVVRAPGATSITKQTLGPGNDVDTTFGPLSQIPSSENNILVLVENVFQISDTNFNLVDNYLGSGDTYIVFTSPVPLDKLITIYFGFAN
jgi:hypothetical protein